MGIYSEKAKALVGQMTLEEKASQLTYQSAAIPRLGVPAYNWWNEALHGVARAGIATSFPQAIGLAAMFDEEFLGSIADIIATEGRAKYNAYSKQGDRDIYKGLTFWSPNVNIFRDPRWGRGHETYGEDPFLSSRLGVSFIKGLQGDGEILKSAACAKHFAVHSGPEDLRHEFNAVVNPKDLWETYLPAFYACVTEGNVEAVMGAYNRTNDEPCCGSYFLLRDILRDLWGFEGHVVSDCWALKDFHMYHGVTTSPEESAALAIDAGCDLNCGNIYLMLLIALEKGLITEEHITRSCERLFTTRYKLGLMEGSSFDQIPYDVVESKEHIESAIMAAQKSIVLLKNDGILPLKQDSLKTIGVIGPNANSRLALKGNYYGTSSRYVTILEGIQDQVGDQVRVMFSEGCELVRDRSEHLAFANDRISEALTVAEHSDVVILCLGLDETVEGEEGDAGNQYASGDKHDLELPAVQKALMEKVIAIGKPVILCLTAGSAMNLDYAMANCQGILTAWYPGARGGKAVADILFGNVSPSGKLPVTFYNSLKDLPEFTDYSMKGRTYRYIESAPQYPFGFGLSYGTVQVKDAKIGDKTEAGRPVKIRVENSSNIDTEDVVQVYIKCNQSAFETLHPRLCGFKRVSIPAGETIEITINLREESLYVINDLGEKVIDSKDYTLYVNNNGVCSRTKELTGVEPISLTFTLD